MSDTELDNKTPSRNDEKIIKENKSLRAVLLGQLTKAKNHLAANIDKMTVYELEVKLGMLESQFANFCTVQCQIERLDEKEVNSNKRDTYEDTYCTLKAQMLEKIQSSKSDVSLDTTNLQFSHVHSHPKIKLPHLELSKFSGSPTEWIDFFSMFSALVHKNNQLSEIEKFQHLRSCLTGKAARLIQSLEVLGKNYHKAIEILQARYDNKRYVFQSHVKQIFELQVMSKPSVANIRNMMDTINANLRALQSLANKDQIADGLLLHLLVSKLDSESQAKWEEEISAKADTKINLSDSTSETEAEFATWDDLSSFLERRCQTIDIIEANRKPIIAQSSAPSQKFTPKPRLINNASFIASQKPLSSSCTFCKASPTHNPFACTKFTNLNPTDRFKLAKELKLCINCLRPNHQVQQCNSIHKCQQCQSSHHTLLHRPKYEETDKMPDDNQEPRQKASTSNSVAFDSSSSALQANCQGSQVILATAIVQLQNGDGIAIPARAILDSASQLNFVTNRIAHFLHLKKTPINLNVCGIGGSKTTARYTCHLKVVSLTTSFAVDLEAVILPDITDYQPQQFVNIQDWDVPKNIKLADKQFNQPSSIDILIGASVFYDMLSVGQIKLGNNLPTLQKTVLGWIVSGPTTNSQHSSSSLHTTIANFTQLPELPPSTSSIEELLQRFWQVEDCITSNTNMTQEELECENFFEETTSRCKNSNKFIVRLPVKSDPASLGESYSIARRRLLSVEHNICRSFQLKLAYCDFMDEYSDLKHMEHIPSTSAAKENLNYIPHHAVIKPDSTTTKLRVVFDASCKTSSGKSLNDILKVGPTLQDDLFTIIVRFRTHRYVIMADITKMYRQIIVDPQDTNLQCILWRNQKTHSIETYRLNTVTYGTSCAPYLAIKCLRKLAHDKALQFPIGSKVTLRDFYVDNLMSGANTLEEATVIKNQVTQLLANSGFPLRKWASNNSSIIADIPDEEKESFIDIGGTEIIKALGLGWNPKEDSFYYVYSPSSHSAKSSKRTILSEASRFFDPLGLLNPIIVKAKILLQTLWKEKYHWDESIPEQLHSQWVEYRNQLIHTRDIKIPRYVPLNSRNLQIHAFADASTKAYGACVYVRSEHENGKVQCQLLCAKSRVAPIKELTLPRLELCAASLLVDLLQKIITIFKDSIHSIYCWTDSTIVLAWIAAEPHRWSTFVANRVSKIQRLTGSATWLHVPTNQNPADLVSRGIFPNQLANNRLWFEGPDFLQHPSAEWSHSQTIINEEVPEQRKTTISMVSSRCTTDLILDCKFHNSYIKTLRVFSYVGRFINNCRSHTFKTSTPSTPTPDGEIHTPQQNNFTPLEFETALFRIIRSIQLNHFASEIYYIQNGKDIPHTSSLRSLAPIIEEGILRVGGRLHQAQLPHNAMHPILLPKNHEFITTLIRYNHIKHLHVGCQALHNILRERFWILGAKDIIRKVIHSCIICFRSRPALAQQIMGSLPKERVIPGRAFSTTGIDYCGPLYVTQRIRGRAPIKSYIAIFICFTTKAVHLELVTELTTSSFIAALKRFVARRGKCRTIYSDNATNFTGADRELRQLRSLFISEVHNNLVSNVCIEDGIEWKFIPPRSPHFGGLWEAAVKIAKHHIRKIIGKASLSFEEMSTVCCQVEAIMNSRPLSPLSDDPSDLKVLTPGHFLIGSPLTTIAEPNIEDIDIPRLKRYQHIQWTQQTFWRRWQKEYLHHLQQRSKWQTSHQNINTGDLVLIKEDNVPPMKWPLGRVITTHEGEDGRVRVATIKTASGNFKRAITKLCPLPIESSTS